MNERPATLQTLRQRIVELEERMHKRCGTINLPAVRLLLTVTIPAFSIDEAMQHVAKLVGPTFTENKGLAGRKTYTALRLDINQLATLLATDDGRVKLATLLNEQLEARSILTDLLRLAEQTEGHPLCTDT